MITLLILYILISNAVTSRRDKSILYSRNAILTLCVIYLLENGIGTFGALFHVNYITQSFNLFILLYNNVNITNKKGEQFKIIMYPLIFTAGIFLISCSDVVSILLSTELQSYGLYLLATLYRNFESSTFAGLTYFLLGGFMLKISVALFHIFKFFFMSLNISCHSTKKFYHGFLWGLHNPPRPHVLVNLPLRSGFNIEILKGLSIYFSLKMSMIFAVLKLIGVNNYNFDLSNISHFSAVVIPCSIISCFIMHFVFPNKNISVSKRIVYSIVLLLFVFLIRAILIEYISEDIKAILIEYICEDIITATFFIGLFWVAVDCIYILDHPIYTVLPSGLNNTIYKKVCSYIYIENRVSSTTIIKDIDPDHMSSFTFRFLSFIDSYLDKDKLETGKISDVCKDQNLDISKLSETVKVKPQNMHMDKDKLIEAAKAAEEDLEFARHAGQGRTRAQIRAAEKAIKDASRAIEKEEKATKLKARADYLAAKSYKAVKPADIPFEYQQGHLPQSTDPFANETRAEAEAQAQAWTKGQAQMESQGKQSGNKTFLDYSFQSDANCSTECKCGGKPSGNDRNSYVNLHYKWMWEEFLNIGDTGLNSNAPWWKALCSEAYKTKSKILQGLLEDKINIHEFPDDPKILTDFYNKLNSEQKSHKISEIKADIIRRSMYRAAKVYYSNIEINKKII